jgi:putative oxidoreductase
VNRTTNLILWLLQTACAAIFLYAGSKKLMAEPAMVAVFAKVGIGQWFRILTGTLEVVGGALLTMPRFSAAAAAMLACVMAGATVSHLTVLGGSPALAIGLLAACLVIAWFRRGQLRLA